MLGRREFQWKGDRLMLGTRNTGCKIIADAKWPNMYRVEYPPGTISDMINLTRARDAAVYIVSGHLNQEPRKRPGEASYSDYSVPDGVRHHPAAAGLTQGSSAALA